MAIDQRLAERRKVVAEDKARRNVGRLLKLLLVGAVVGVIGWFVFSPHLSVSEVRVTGVEVSETYAILAEQSVIAGTPMVKLNTEEIERALGADPWIAEADVALSWPDLVVVNVRERVPEAWVETDSGWQRRAIDGVGLPSPKKPDADMAWIRFPNMPELEAGGTTELLGALEFVSALTPDLKAETIVQLEGDGEMWAQVAGYRVRLGRPVEMTEKALSLVALIRTGPPLDNVLVLVAPTHPALAPIGDSSGTANRGAKQKGNKKDASDGKGDGVGTSDG